MFLQCVEYVVKTWFIILIEEMIIRKYSNANRFFLDITINNVLQLFDIHVPTTFVLPNWTQTVTCILHLLIFWLILSYYRKIRDSRNLDFPPFNSSYLSVSWCNLGHHVLWWTDQNYFLVLVTFCIWHQIKSNYKIWNM